MTKEQIINQYISVYEGHAMEKEELEIMLNGFADDIVNNLEPYLPDNLDEAAKDYCNSQPEWENKILGWVEEKDKEECRRDFKAGAEWMAKQGEIIFDTIVIDGQGQRWLTDNLLQGDYDCGEEVIVQIRKNQ